MQKIQELRVSLDKLFTDACHSCMPIFFWAIKSVKGQLHFIQSLKHATELQNLFTKEISYSRTDVIKNVLWLKMYCNQA